MVVVVVDRRTSIVFWALLVVCKNVAEKRVNLEIIK